MPETHTTNSKQIMATTTLNLKVHDKYNLSEVQDELAIRDCKGIALVRLTVVRDEAEQNEGNVAR